MLLHADKRWCCTPQTGCLADEPPLMNPKYANLSKPLGAPLADAALSAGVWSRTFAHGAVARWYTAAGTGTMQWPGDPMPPIPVTPPPQPPPHNLPVGGKMRIRYCCLISFSQNTVVFFCVYFWFLFFSIN